MYYDGIRILMFHLIIVDYFCDYLSKILICKKMILSSRSLEERSRKDFSKMN